MTDITIYHNPACGTSRNTLALIQNSGVEPTVILYLENPPSRDQLSELISAMGISVRALLRKNVEPYEQLGLAEDRFTDEEMIEAMLSHPILINRPIVVTPLGTRLCRPSEVVLEILPNPQQGEFIKEDGEKVVDKDGKPLI
ncbi:TPA: glutaredoxin-dependent arsenate reductase [Klebsiella michiganensis]|uniref:glutaredoxin-dependent arsenate reductase n=1 Tax=Klebsiella/Raoultella group TaxID=2890311 RepID=UPI0004683663|nr:MULTISPECIES: glutaredoxin-dependent arsenate reductase [Klebsiella]HBR5868708.1 glutaredoxin-dependent arsenate reductase [Klebsiella pneumoniae]EKQ6536112.1 glutaredoxin-dependent arsenate reductase [Klebsiella michiganensis]ELQ7988155.1 glutaredoxin-dependent arsenate reductase [Klebsiella michiganensis]MBZ7914096.1 arsenate reductase (glutaredoxin) [Klebsiella michiganensis]MCW9597329.1 glutaredoxin-dependent arsenate reductase [Klebsiella michiganensis]